MNVLPCGESGVVATLFHELADRRDANSLLEGIQSRTRFPYISAATFRVFRSEMLLDVNFNKLGQSSAIMLIDTGSQRISVFVQVKTSTKGPWSIEEEFQRFLDGPGAVGYASNLFSELYAKHRLVKGLASVGIKGLQEGLSFPPSASGKTVRKLGNNPITFKALERIRDYLDDSFFVAVVPEEGESLARFFDQILRDAAPQGFDDWDVRHWGFLSWQEVRKFSTVNRLDRTRNALDLNKSLF